MSLFGRARKMMQGLGPAEPPKPQYYRVPCPEGHTLRGTRTEGYQALRCPECGEGVFVLPRSPLPTPPAPRDRPRREPEPPPHPVADDEPIRYSDVTPEVVPAEAEIEWEESEPQDAPAEAQARPLAEVEIPEPEPERPKGPKPAARPRPAVAPAPESDELPVVAPRRRRLRKLAIPLAMIAILGATVTFQFRRQHRQALPKIAETNRAEGMQALESGTLDVAKLKLGRAASALEELGDDAAPKVRQAADEAALLADLASASLPEILEEYATRADGPERFNSVHKGRAFLIDDEIAAVGPDGPDLNLRVLVGSAPRPKVGRIDLKDFALTAERKTGDHVTFLARLAGIALGDDGRWVIRLEPSSGVAVRSDEAWKALDTLGWHTGREGNP